MVKRVWKRLIAVLLLVVMAFSLCGCEGESDLERAQRELEIAERENEEAQQRLRELRNIVGY